MRQSNLLTLIALTVYVQLLLPVSVFSQDTTNISIKSDTTELIYGSSYLNFDNDQLSILPFHNLSTFGLMAPSAYKLKGDRMFYYGIEATGDHIFIDGMQVADAVDFPVRIIQSYCLYTSQTPINMGFATGAITSIETLTQLNDFTVLVDVNRDQTYDAQGVAGEIFINIPFTSRKRKAKGKLVPSLLIAGSYSWTNNTDPVWKRTQKLNSETLAELTANPFRLPTPHGFIEQNAEYITSSNMMEQKVANNSGKTGISPFVKLHLPISKNININIGNYSVIDETELYNRSNAVFNSVNNATRSRRNFDTYLNWNHSIEVNEDLSFNYDFNFQYSNYHTKIRDKNHKDRFFDYGYVGKFTSYKTPTYEYGSETVDGQHYENVWVLNSWNYDTLVTFEPSNINSGLSAYTSNYYDIYSGYPQGHYQTMDDVVLGGGLVNGRSPRPVYGLYNNTGSVTAGYQENSFEKIRAAFRMNVDFRTHHLIIGGEYNRETQSHFSISPNGLWNIIRDGIGLTNFHLHELDKDNPILLTYNGHVDSIIYFRKYDGNAQREFDKNLRLALGLPVDGLDYIVTDSYDRENNTINYYDKYGKMHTISTPENFLSLEMFSEEELLNDGLSLVNYAGYTYTGDKQNGKVDPYSFFKDYTIAASKPEYWSVFIQDEFELENLRVRLGLRMDVYDANRPVLKDEYSLYPIYNAKEASANDELVFDKPDNIGDDYFVYVDKVKDPTKVVGYRNGDIWFNNNGIEILDPMILNVGNGVSPYLVDPDIRSLGDENWSPSMTFQDYSKTINFLPQISIDYTIINRINLYTNYSSFTSNPSYLSDFRPDQYLFFNNYSQTQIMSNPDLIPMRTGKLFAGIKAGIWRNLVADISYVKTTIDNLLSGEAYVGAYPNEYVAVVNRKERRSTQGFEVKFVWINQSASGLSGNVSFTRLFPEDEKYNYNSISNMVINSNVSYQFGRGESFTGPTWLNEKIFQGFPASIYYQHRHGLPYVATRDNYFSDGIKYTPNINIFNLNLQKDFLIGNKAMLNVYLVIENLFNFKNVFEVYSDTGEADDDGFLSDPTNDRFIENQLNPESYRLLYQMNLYNPQHYDIPRIWRVGLTFRY